MQMILQFLLVMLIILLTETYAKNYNAVELNRLRLKNLYRNHVLIRPSMKNHTRTTVALGLGVIEVAGIDPQKQVCATMIVYSNHPFLADYYIECQSGIALV